MLWEVPEILNGAASFADVSSNSDLLLLQRDICISLLPPCLEDRSGRRESPILRPGPLSLNGAGAIHAPARHEDKRLVRWQRPEV